MRVGTRPGLALDHSPYAVGGEWWSGYNIRWVAGAPETIGLWRELPCVDDQGAAAVRAPFSAAHALGIVQANHDGGQATCIYAAANTALQVAPIVGLEGGYTVQTLDWQDVTPSGGMPDVEDQAAVTQMLGVPTGRVQAAKADKGVVVHHAGGDTAWYWELETTTPAMPLANVPPDAVDIEVLYEGHLGALGCRAVNCADGPLIYRISERGDFENWAISTSGTAAEWVIYHRDATHAVAVGQVSEGHLIWTDVGVSWARFDPAGYPPYRIDTIHIGSGLAARDAWVEIDRQVVWLGADLNFWIWGGSGDPQPLYCPLRDSLVRRIDRTMLAYRVKAHRSAHGEAVFTLCVGGPDPDVQLVFSPRERAWSVWRLPRWSWSHGPHALGLIAMGVDGRLYHHELVPSGSDDPYRDDLGGAHVEPIAAADVASRPWALATGLISTPEHPEVQVAEALGVRAPMAHRAAAGAGDPAVEVALAGHRDGNALTSQHVDAATITGETLRAWRRTSGDGVQLRLAADNKVWTRCGPVDVKAARGGER